MKLRLTKDTAHRGVKKLAGSVIEEQDVNHVGQLQCAGAVPVPDDTPVKELTEPAKPEKPAPAPKAEEKTISASEALAPKPEPAKKAGRPRK